MKIRHALFALSGLIASSYTSSAYALETRLESVFPTLTSGVAIDNNVVRGIDPSALTLSHDATVTAYFISEGAGYKNSFGWYDASTDPTQYNNRNELWDNASALGSGGSLTTGSSALVGSFEAGTELGFYLTANGFYTGDAGHTYYTNDDLNPDGISHIVAGILPEQGLLAIGFEDLFGGGDRDYDDIIFAIDIGVENAKSIAAGAPEPSEWALMMVGLGTVLGMRRRQLQKRRTQPAGTPENDPNHADS